MAKRRLPGGQGTGVRRVADMSKWRAAMAGPGIDSRHWVSYGTVGTTLDDGTFDVTDKSAIYVGPEGVEVDVMLEPIRVPVTAHYAGIYGGSEVTMFAPIHAGDRVILVMPEGGTVTPVIIGVLHSAAVKVPIGTNNKPRFQNDRVLIYSKTVPVEVNAPQIRLGMDSASQGKIIEQAGKIQIGSDQAGEALLLGNAWKTWMGNLLDAIAALTVLCATPGNASSPPVNIAVFQQLKLQLSSLLSGKAFTEK